MAATGTSVELDGHLITLTNLDKPLYPNGFTKAEVIQHYL
ncbi:MAG TPA: ATP-dependent DNA ligase, partial [Propionibacteriaceae bacterium]|nr:ATP-dependent DNA ligase [Propionibacteriaceae bacterium]